MEQLSTPKDRRASASSSRSPTTQHAPLTPGSSRRPSSSIALRQSASSPRLNKRSSRSSLPGQSPQLTPDGDEKRPTPKRSINTLISGLREAQAQSSMEPIAEPIRLTAPEIAKAHFLRELTRMETNDAETLVVLHDACYGHRFSRPRTSKGALSMIVERPERLHAGVLGAATAFVRMGGHHEGHSNAPKPEVEGEAQGSPAFKIRRTARTMDVGSSFVTNVHGTSWMEELKGMCDAAGGRLARGEKELARESTTEGGEKRTLHEGDLYLCTESLNAFQGALGGVADAIDAVFSTEMRTKRAFAAVRPPGHHCSADYPSGFCWLNNVHVGLEYAAQTHGLTHAAIVDFDLHHGDGSQSITWDRNSKNNIKRINAKFNSKLRLGPDIGYYSLHDINSYPCESGDNEKVQAASLCIENAHGQSIWNVHLQTWKTVDEFWQLYESRYKVLLEKARIFLRHHTSRLRSEGKVQPKAAIFISAGFDASEWEGSGMQRHKVNVPTEFYARFTRDMVQLAQEEGTACDGRVISVLEGGYSDRALCSGVLSHLSGLSLSSPLASSVQSTNGTDELDQRMLGLSLQNGSAHPSYDTQWWSEDNLTALELKVNPPPPPPAAKKYRTGQQPTYATPTESFAYKVNDPERFARSISGTMRESPIGSARPPTPPVPEVDWVIATQELVKLLIPQDRQTKSCAPEELAAPKKAAVVLPPAKKEDVERPRQLRTRAKASQRENADEMSRADRRRTIGDLPVSTEPAPAAATQAKRSSRRSSLASTQSSAPTESNDVPPVPSIVTTTNSAMQPPPMPTAGPGEVQSKKPRAPPKLKKQAVPASAPVSPVASFKRQPPPLSQSGAPLQPPNLGNSVAVPPQPAQSPTADMDALTTGLKKVTLKVGSREDHDRKMKERLDAERRARALRGAETRRVNKAAREAKIADAKMAEAKMTPAQRAKAALEAGKKEEIKPTAAVSQATEFQQTAPATEPRMDEAQHPERPEDTTAFERPVQTECAPREPQTEAQQLPPTAPGAPQFTMPVYQAPPTAPVPASAPAPDMPPLEVATAQQPPPSSRPPPLLQSRQSSSSLYRFVPVMNEATSPSSRPSTSFPSPTIPTPPEPGQILKQNVQTQSDLTERTIDGQAGPDRALPVFSSTGYIPFAGANPAQSGADDARMHGNGETQLHSTSYGTGHPTGPAMSQSTSGSQIQHEQSIVAKSEAAASDIWDVPETPRK